MSVCLQFTSLLVNAWGPLMFTCVVTGCRREGGCCWASLCDVTQENDGLLSWVKAPGLRAGPSEGFHSCLRGLAQGDEGFQDLRVVGAEHLLIVVC